MRPNEVPPNHPVSSSLQESFSSLWSVDAPFSFGPLESMSVADLACPAGTFLAHDPAISTFLSLRSFQLFPALWLVVFWHWRFIRVKHSRDYTEISGVEGTKSLVILLSHPSAL